MSWSPDPDDGPIGPAASSSTPAWPQRDLWPERAAPEPPRVEADDDWPQPQPISPDPSWDDAPYADRTYAAPAYEEEYRGDGYAQPKGYEEAAAYQEVAGETAASTYDEPTTYADTAYVPAELDRVPVRQHDASLREQPVEADEIAAEPLERWDPRRYGERRTPTTAEQAVPWLIGIILALTGIVIVLLALIFTSENGALAGSSPSVLPGIGLGGSGQPTPTATPLATATASVSVTPSAVASPSAAPAPAFGALEMVYLGRKTATAPVYLWRRDFSKQGDAKEAAIAEQGITKVAWAPDGSVGAVIVDGHVVAIDADGKKRALFDGASEITFGVDASTLYVVQIGQLSGKERAQVFAVDFATGSSKRLTDLNYARPQIVKDPPLQEAAFADDGGLVRLYPTADGNLVLWILGAPESYRIDPLTGSRAAVRRVPTLASPDGTRRVEAKASGSSTTLTLYDSADTAKGSIKVSGLVSHIRWAPNGSEISFTLGTLGRNGGIVQNLYLWDLVDGKKPMQLTSNGASFGAEWLGAAQSWQP